MAQVIILQQNRNSKKSGFVFLNKVSSKNKKLGVDDSYHSLSFCGNGIIHVVDIVSTSAGKLIFRHPLDTARFLTGSLKSPKCTGVKYTPTTKQYHVHYCTEFDVIKPGLKCDCICKNN